MARAPERPATYVGASSVKQPKKSSGNRAARARPRLAHAPSARRLFAVAPLSRAIHRDGEGARRWMRLSEQSKSVGTGRVEARAGSAHVRGARAGGRGRMRRPPPCTAPTRLQRKRAAEKLPAIARLRRVAFAKSGRHATPVPRCNRFAHKGPRARAAAPPEPAQAICGPCIEWAKKVPGLLRSSTK